MSRTLAHRPERARFDDPSSCFPVHDHRDGPCDLPTLVEWHDWVNHGDGEQPWRCEWELSWYLWPKLCSCRTCSDYYWNRENRRRHRHRSRLWLATGAWIEEWVDRPVRH